MQLLQRAGTPSLRIDERAEHFTEETASEFLPLADRVAVGADDVEARWWVQRHWPAHLYVGATGDREAILTTHHPGQPCAGCVHPDPLALAEGDFALLEELDHPGPARGAMVYPFGLGEGSWHLPSTPRPSPRCPIRCAPSRGIS